MAQVEQAQLPGPSAECDTHAVGGSSKPARVSKGLSPDAPVFQPEELPRPANLKTLKTRRSPTYQKLDAVPFTPSQGIATPSPNNMAAYWFDQQQFHVYPGTPQASASVPYREASGSTQPGSDESSTASYQGTFSPFYWASPVSPSAFPIPRQGQHVLGTLLDPSRTHQYSPILSSSQELIYPYPQQPGSPMFISPGSPMLGAAWNNNFQRQRSRMGQPFLLVQAAPGSPAYPGMHPSEFQRHPGSAGFSAMPLNAQVLVPMPGSPPFGGMQTPGSPVWAAGTTMQLGHFMQPGTPPRSSFPGPIGLAHKGTQSNPAPTSRGSGTLTEVLERPTSCSLGDSSTPESSLGAHQMLNGLPVSMPENLPRLNARQRRTLRRAQERARNMAELAAEGHAVPISRPEVKGEAE